MLGQLIRTRTPAGARRLTTPTGFALLASLAALAASLALAGPASAATYNVTRADDPVPVACQPNNCSLREAVRAANATAANDRIVLRARNYVLSQPGADEDDALTGDLDVVAGSGRLIVIGKGRGKTRITGDGADRVLDVRPDAHAALRKLTVAGGFASQGGAIRNAGKVGLRNVALRSSESSFGGGIFSTGTAQTTITRSLIAGNEASFGGGIFDNNNSVVTIVRTVIRGNKATGVGGGGIFNQNDSKLVVKQSTIAGNRVPSGIGGGGIFNQNQANARILASTISANRTSGDGGGIYAQNQSFMRLTNATVSGNRADQGGGAALSNQAKVRFEHATIAANRAQSAAGAILEAAVPPGPPNPPYFTFRATLVAGNSAPMKKNCAIDDAAHVRSLGANLENANSCRFNRKSDRRKAAAKLAKLARNGGPTATHALKKASRAIDVVRRKACPKRDQRGVKRPQGKRCDTGAFERAG